MNEEKENLTPQAPLNALIKNQPHLISRDQLRNELNNLEKLKISYFERKKMKTRKKKKLNISEFDHLLEKPKE